MDLLRGNFKPQHEVTAEEEKDDPQAAYEKKAKESIGGSMVFVERRKLYHDPKV
jgi:hypothetical protein